MTQYFVKIGRYFFPYAKYHKLPLPFLCVVAAMSMFLYQLSMSMMIVGFSLVTAGSDGYHNLLDILNLTETTKDFFGGLFVGVPVVVVFSPLVALCLSGFLLLHMIGSISKLVKLYSREGFSEKLPSKLSIAPSAWKYLGSQFGYFVYAWVIYLLLSLVLGLAGVAIFYGFKYFTTYFVNLLLILVIPVLWTRLLFFAQLLICKFVFFEDSKGKFISITNRRLFNWFSLVLFLYNGFAGFVGAIIRVAFSAVVTLLLLFRLDTVVMAKGFEFLDFGHRAFLGFFYLHFCYNNAVVNTFIHLLQQETKGTSYNSPERHIQEEVSSPLLGSSPQRVYDRTPTTRQLRYHNRWLVAYTLIRNPQLQKLTAKNIAKSKMSMLSCEVEGEVDVMGSSRGHILTFETYPPLPKQAV